MLSLGAFKKRSGDDSTIGIELRESGFCVSTLSLKADPCIDFCGFHDYASSGVVQDESVDLTDRFAKALPVFLDSQKLNYQNCHVILDAQDYQLLLVEDPGVPTEELHEALRWRVKDLSNVALEHMSLEVFSLPASRSNNSAKKMLYAVITDKRKIRKISEAILASGLRLKSINIGEMALRDLTALSEKEVVQHRGAALVRMTQNKGHISIFNQSELYLSRYFKVDYNAGLLDELPVESLALEVQRSLDYYERQMGQAQPGVLYICGDNISGDKINDALKNALALEVRWLDLTEFFPLSDSVDEDLAQLCVVSLGASVREKSLAEFNRRKAAS